MLARLTRGVCVLVALGLRPPPFCELARLGELKRLEWSPALEREVDAIEERVAELKRLAAA